MEIAVMLPAIDRALARLHLWRGFMHGHANLMRRLVILRQRPGLQTSMVVIVPVAPAALVLVWQILGLNALRTRFTGTPPAFTRCIGTWAILGVWVFRNGGRNLRLRYHGGRRTRALLAPPLATPRPIRPLLLSRIRRTRFKRPLAGIGVAHVFVHSRRAKTFRPQQAPARFCRWRDCNSLPRNRQILFAGNLFTACCSWQNWRVPDLTQKNRTFAP